MKKYYIVGGAYMAFCLVTLALIDNYEILSVAVFGGLAIVLLCFKLFLIQEKARKVKDELYASEKGLSLLLESLSQNSLSDIRRAADKLLEEEKDETFQKKYRKIMRQASMEWVCKLNKKD